MSTRCFWLEELPRMRRYLRRYSEDCKCLGDMVFLDEIDWPVATATPATEPDQVVDLTDERWPKACPCGRAFEPRDAYQIFQERVYRRTDSGDTLLLDDAPAGAMWDAWWWGEHRCGPDGLHLMVRLPDGHDWFIDGRASNCTMPDDHEHRCWCRHGKPPTITVDKNCNTCNAGAGSIQTPRWHGFLRNGELVL